MKKLKILLENTLNNGFQIEPLAFDLLRELIDKKVDLNNILNEIINQKQLYNLKKYITKEDINKFYNKIYDENLEKSDIKIRNIKSSINIIYDTNNNTNILEGLNGYKKLFLNRLKKTLKIIRNRPDFFLIESINSVNTIKKDGVRKIVGLVMNKRIRKNTLLLTLDDNTGFIELLGINKKIINDGKQILLDSVAIIDLEISKNGTPIIKNISPIGLPERYPNFSNKRIYAVFTSDLHIGSKNFLINQFENFIDWLSSDNEDNKIVNKIKYLIIAGDAIDGIGVYPGQENDLVNLNIKDQYFELSQLLKKIPKSIDIFIIAGNHDPVRQALPQPIIPKKYAEELYKMSNIKLLGNPSLISLHGVNIMVYHGRSLDDVIASTPGYSFSRPAIAMKSLLKARHLAPIYGERTSVIPDNEDNLVIDNVPDIFHSGHIHTLDSENYKNVLILNSGTWQSQTAFQLKMGILPTPGIVPIVDLSNHNVFSRDFN
jgi:DNA polymerase II small subunit